ncbi:MAG: hypothetical protein HY293_20580 [Planctomycetes bacterium]|nr:hypothetical protein [Planctomycetota bacterium]
MVKTFAVLLCLGSVAVAQETIWVEAEHLEGVRGYCWPGGQNPKTDGHWGISGPGWAAEWTQGGESNFMSIACGAADDKAVAGLDLDLPVADKYRVWIRFRDNRGTTSRFQVRLTPPGGAAMLLTYGQKPVVEEDNEMKLYWDWAFAWESREASLPKGKVRLDLLSAFAEKQCRQVDCIVLTTDAAYRPLIKERPKHPTEELLRHFRKGIDPKLEPLARRTGDFQAPASWKPATFRDKGFLYLWNMSHLKWAEEDPKRVLFPYHIGDKDVQAAFEKKYGGAEEVPIFSDPRIVPTFHNVGPAILAVDAKDAGKKKSAEAFVRWLDAHPDRAWAQMMNYHGGEPVTPAAKENFLKYRDRYVGNIAGESLGYFYPKEEEVKAATAGAHSRRELAAAFSPLCLASNAEKYRKLFGADWPEAYREVIPCQSIGMTAFAPLSYQWGARTVGYESSAITAGLLSLRMAFLRGAARQNGGLTATYRSCNFGDASTIFSESQSYTKPKNILDNFYSVFSGAGMTWYKMDLWHQYMSGSSMFYHEQGFDEFWIPGGTAAAGVKEVQLSPKGKLVDRFLRVTAAHPDRGTPFTPVAILVDYAHGWDPAPFHPHAFGDMAKRPDLTLYGDHEQMLREVFWTAYHPIGARSEEPITATNETYVHGVFGDIFDVIYAYPDVKRWTTILTYPVVVAAGDLELTAEEGKLLAQYVAQGGTLLVTDGQLSGAGAAALELPEMGTSMEAAEYVWAPTGTRHASQRFRMKPLSGGRALATEPGGKSFCSAFDRGKGRLILLSVPRGLGIDRTAVPALARLFAHLTRGLLPVEVEGDVEWMLNRSGSGWIVTLLNSAGQAKPQHGITPTDFRQNRTVQIRSRVAVESASDWLFPSEALGAEADGSGSRLELTVPAGGVRILDLKNR